MPFFFFSVSLFFLFFLSNVKKKKKPCCASLRLSESAGVGGEGVGDVPQILGRVQQRGRLHGLLVQVTVLRAVCPLLTPLWFWVCARDFSRVVAAAAAVS